MRSNLKTCRKLVETLQPFKGSNVASENISLFCCTAERGDEFYVVYSYEWYPILAYDRQHEKWYENEQGYSPTTKRQIASCKPWDCEIRPMPDDIFTALVKPRGLR